MFVGALFNSYSLQYYSFQMSQGRVIDIMTYSSYSLQYYSFGKAHGSSDHRIIGLFSLSHEQNLTFRLSERKIKLA